MPRKNARAEQGAVARYLCFNEAAARCRGKTPTGRINRYLGWSWLQ